MKRLWMSGAAAVMAMSIASVGAQTPQTPPPQTQPPTQTPKTQPPSTSPMQATKTLEGCVYKASDLPGHTADPAAASESYVLVASASPSGAAGTSGTTPPAGTAGTAGMASANKAFKLEKVEGDKLKEIVGKRVEVTGRVDTGATGTAGAPPADPGKADLPEFEVSSIKEVEGSCPATPAIR